MKAHQLLGVASGVFLIAALASVFMVLRPPNDGVRIPVCASNGKWGYIDSSGRMVIATKWDYASPFGPDDHARVYLDDKTSRIAQFVREWLPSFLRFTLAGEGFYRIDRLGKKSAPLRLGCGVEPYLVDSFGMALADLGHGYGWVHKDGSPAFPGTWLHAFDFKGEDPASVFNGDQWHFINRHGEPVIPFSCDSTYGFDGFGRALVEVDGKWGVIDREGRLIVPLYFKSLAGFDAQNMCAAQLSSGWGFIDPNGKIQIPFRFQVAESFDRFDMAKVGIMDHQGNLRCGWINRHGEFVVQPLYQVVVPTWAKNFKGHELLPVIGPNGPGLIDRAGRTVVASAPGELKTVEDPAAPGRFWIRTVPHPPVLTPFDPSHPSYVSICYDQTGNVIWNDGIFTSPRIFMICANLFGLIAAILFATLRLCRSSKPAHV